MADVLIALLPATVAGCVIFGLKALLPIFVCIISSVGFEALFNIITKREQTVGDLSAAVTGLLLALNLPADIPIWQCVVGSLFAIIVVKCLFGGLGNNLVNPAITARVFMIVAFEAMAVVSFPVDAVSGATPLSSGETPSLMTLFLGNYGGAIGETCTLALLVGGIYLIVRRVITWHIPVVFIGTVFIFSLFIEGFEAITALSLIMSGGLVIGAIFMATDYVTSPFTRKGKIIFGIGLGLITCLIRFWGNMNEGVSYSILLMNLVVPAIDAATRRKPMGGAVKK
jgi:electron transport complex protein RnfD